MALCYKLGSSSLETEVKKMLSWRAMFIQHHAGNAETGVDVICVNAEHMLSCFMLHQVFEIYTMHLTHAFLA